MRRVTLLIGNDPVTRLGIRMAINGEAEICAEVDDPAQAIRAAKREQPDVCLISRALCGEAMATVRGICRAAPNVAVVVLADIGDEDDLLDAIRAGAIGYMPGAIDSARLRRIISAVAANEAGVPGAMVLDQVLVLRVGGGGGDDLTWREAQLVVMLRRGHTTASIAKRLGIAPVTVRRHISELVHKLGVADRSELLTGGWWADARKPREHAVHSG